MNTLAVDSKRATKVLVYNLSEPLGGARRAMIDIHAGDGNLAIDRLNGSEPVLASGTLEYLEKQGAPTRSLVENEGFTALNLKGNTRQTWFQLPWAACNGATEWQVHLNPEVPIDLTAHSRGGNLELDLALMAVTSVSADTGGGNVAIVLPERVANLTVTARTGAGNVVVSIPSGVAARIHASTGLGKTILDPRFSKMDSNTYQSADYDPTAHKVELTLSSGVGNVSIRTYEIRGNHA